jgi:hypothetical protein
MSELDRNQMSEHNRRTAQVDAAPAGARVREDDLEPHAGLRYIARLFKVLAILLALLLIGEVIVGLVQDGTSAIGTLLIQATRLIVFAAFLWAAGDLALMLIESNHDLRATRILLGRVNASLQELGSRPGADLPPQVP